MEKKTMQTVGIAAGVAAIAGLAYAGYKKFVKNKKAENDDVLIGSEEDIEVDEE